MNLEKCIVKIAARCKYIQVRWSCWTRWYTTGYYINGRHAIEAMFVERLGNIIAGFTKIITEEICVLKMMMGEYKRRLFSIFFLKFCLHSIFYVFIWLPLKLFFNNIGVNFWHYVFAQKGLSKNLALFLYCCAASDLERPTCWQS